MARKKTPEPRIDTIPGLVTEAQSCLTVAHKNKKSMTGTNYYARRFEDLHSKGVLLIRALRLRLSRDEESEVVSAIDEIDKSLSSFFQLETEAVERRSIEKRIRFLFGTVIEPSLSSVPQHIPEGQLFPLDILPPARNYLARIAEQANGSYEQGWYDAAAVMVRRLLETLIIECYERYKLEAKIKDRAGNFLHLRDLIDRFLAETAWNSSRNLKAGLPKYKDVGDLSAHNRHFLARRRDLEEHKDKLRQAIEELAIIAEYSAGTNQPTTTP